MNVVFRLRNTEFEWDDSKALANVEKHGVTFEEAAEVFFDQLAVYGDASMNAEERDYILGYTMALQLLLVVHTERRLRTRIISARPATYAERKRYEREQF